MPEDLKESVDSLGSTVNRLTEAVDHQTDSALTLAEQVSEGNRRAKRDRKILRRLLGLMVFKLVTLFILAIVIFGLNKTNHTLNDCVSPDGKCSQRSSRVLAITTDSLAYRTELQRLETELPISEAKGDAIRVGESKQRIAELQGKIDDADARIRAIQQQSKDQKPS